MCFHVTNWELSWGLNVCLAQAAGSVALTPVSSWVLLVCCLRGCKGCWWPQRCLYAQWLGTRAGSGGGWLEPVACMCLAAGTSCRCLCGVRGRLQTHTLWWQPEQAAKARANDRLIAAAWPWLSVCRSLGVFTAMESSVVHQAGSLQVHSVCVAVGSQPGDPCWCLVLKGHRGLDWLPVLFPGSGWWGLMGKKQGGRDAVGWHLWM